MYLDYFLYLKLYNKLIFQIIFSLYIYLKYTHIYSIFNIYLIYFCKKALFYKSYYDIGCKIKFKIRTKQKTHTNFM